MTSTLPPARQPSQQPLRLADHVRACCADGQVILLDLRRNRYVSVAAFPGLAGVIGGWPTLPGDTTVPTRPAQLSRLMAPLQAQGLVTDRPSVANSNTPSLSMPARSLNANETVPHHPAGWLRFARFHRCAASAALRLRCQSLGTIAAAVVQRRADLEGAGLAGADLSGADAAETLVATQAAVEAYQRLRLFAFTAHNRCLHDALTLVSFLATEGIAAHWVIGVRTRPFGAHAWVQIGDMVLNDQHEQVRRFAPILVA